MGYSVALISGSMDVLVEMIARELNISLWAANNHFIFDEGGLLKDINTDGNEVNTKLKQAMLFCEQLGISITDCMAVGDDFNDTLLFKETNNGVTFEGSKYANNARHAIAHLREIAELVSC